MRHLCQWDNDLEKWIWHDIEDAPVSEYHYVQDDIAFASPDGAQIGSRSQWREHLKRTGTVEMGHSDIKNAEENWKRRRDDFATRANRTSKEVRPVAPPEGEITAYRRTELDKAMLNRLDNRPAPDRKLLVKLALETARELAKRR